MAKQEKATAAEAAKPKRTQLTPEQRVAKLEAELEAARKKAEERANKGRTKALERRAALVTRRDKLNEEIAAIDSEFPPADTDEDTES